MWHTVLLALGLGIDTFAVGLSLGIANQKDGWRLALRMAVVLAVFQTVAPVLGWLGARPLLPMVERYAHWVSFALLAYAAGRMIWEGIEGEEESAFLDLRSWRSLLFLGVATSLDELAVGVGWSLGNRPIILLAALDLVFTFALALIGALLGERVGDELGERAPLLGGVVLLYIAVRILLEHVGPWALAL